MMDGMRLPSRRAVGAAAVGWLVALASVAGAASAGASPLPVALGAAGSFAVLGASTVTSTGASALTGDLGVSPGTAVTGFPPGTLVGSLHAGDGPAAQAHTDLATAYQDAAGRSAAAPEAGPLDGLTLGPGVYAAGASLSLTGTLTLNAGGDPNAVFILQAGSTLITAANSQVDLAGGAQACNVFWQVGSSATLGASSLLRGTILASASISMGDAVTLDGRALANTGAVTMINDAVTVAGCAGSLSNTAPAVTPFSAKLTGLTRTLHTELGAWSVTDATGSNAGYSVTVAATRPTVNGSVSAAGTGGGLTLTPVTATPANGNTAATGPLATSAQTLSTTAATIATAAAGTGQGEWDFPADSGAAESLAIVIPGDASAGAYSSTLTFTTAPPAA
jgi:ice-binding like protein/putative surface cell wall-binding protein